MSDSDLRPAAPPGDLIAGVLRGFRSEFVWIVAFGFVINLLMLTPTLYMMQVFDRVFVSNSVDTLAALSVIVAFLFLILGFADWARARLLVRVGTRFDALTQPQVFRASVENQLHGRTVDGNQALADLRQLRQFLTGSGAFAIVDVPWAVVYVAALFLIHPLLGWLAVALVGLTLAVALFGNRRVSPRYGRAQELLLQSNRYLAGKLRHAETVQAMGMLANLRRRWLTLEQHVDAGAAAAAESGHHMQSWFKFQQHAQSSLVLAAAAVLAIHGLITAGAMFACNALMSGALRPIAQLAQSWRAMIEARAAHGRLAGLLGRDTAPPATRQEPPPVAAMTLDGLVATAAGRQQPILDTLHAKFHPGEVVAIVGPSGAGKSTLARCLLGIWPGAGSQVLIGGVPLTAWSHEARGPAFGYLPQDIELFDGTIAENIARFQPDAEEQVVEAARVTGIHEMVLRMPKGYDTLIGEAGAFLSGGQRQRIGLARAVLGRPQIVVLDEPSSSLDDAGEAALLRAVAALKGRGAIVFLIVHQKHLLAAADRVLVLEGGHIAQLAHLQHGVPAPKAAAATVTAT